MRIRLRGVDYSIGKRTLFRDLNLDVQSGEMVGLMGPSGAGKSTLLSAIAVGKRFDVGSIEIEPYREICIAWVVQSAPVLVRRSALSNVMLGGLSSGLARNVALAEAIALMRDLGVTHLAHQLAYRLSGGERQRLAVARAIAQHADVVLADEPTASLDPQSRRSVIDALEVAAARGSAVLVATHDPVVAARCTRVVRLDDGVLDEPEALSNG